MSLKPSILICAPQRTPIGSLSGALASVSAPTLGQTALTAVLEKSKAPLDSIEQVIMGCVLAAGVGQGPARQVALFSGLPNSVQALTVNKVCSSSLKAVMLAADAISCGHAEAIIAGGMESMSQAPYLIPALRRGARLGHTQALDSTVQDGLWDIFNDFHMGEAAELCAERYGLTREMQDSFANESYSRAVEAEKKGYFKEEIAQVVVTGGRREVRVSVDEEPTRWKPEKVATLRAAFKKDGTVTAANASSVNDGAAAMLVCSEAYAKKHKIKPFARIVSQGWHAQEPEWFTTAPVGAVNMALGAAGIDKSRVDLFEINEAFSAVALACRQELDIPAERLNICGGAVALGHPIGASGARILTTLLHALKRTKGKIGVAGICNGGGEATAVLVENIS